MFMCVYSCALMCLYVNEHICVPVCVIGYLFVLMGMYVNLCCRCGRVAAVGSSP